MSKLMPGTAFPDLEIQTLSGGLWKLSEQRPELMTAIFVYRGYHCPVCKKQLQDIQQHMDQFKAAGVNVIAVSMDSQERAKKSREEWEVDAFPVGYDLSEETARRLGLYISESISDKEPATFSEPGLFLVQPDQTLYSVHLQSTPFARPTLDGLFKGFKHIKENQYPPRGTKSQSVAAV